MNIYDIAREAGVSIATVSRVLNHKDTVRADTRAKVEKVLKRCNYAPSAIAQGMVSKSLHTVAVLTVDIRDSHYARTAYTIEREFGRRGYEVILCNTGGDRAETLRTLQAVAQKQVDGLILVGSIFNTICQGAEMENLLRKMPVVLANGTLALPDAYSVMVDDCRGVEMAVEHLVKTGRRSLYYIVHRQRRCQGEGLPLRDDRCRSGRRRACSRNRRDAGGRHPRGAAAFGRGHPPGRHSLR